MSDGCGGEGQGVPRALGLPSQQLDRQLLPRHGPAVAVWRRSDPVTPPRAGKSLGGDYAQSRGLDRIAALRPRSCTRETP
jgi:hypothetical protein